MRTDIEKGMEEYQLDAIIALGSFIDPTFSYFTRAVQVRDSLVLYRRKEQWTILTWEIDTTQAIASGMQVTVFDSKIYRDALGKTDDPNQALLQLYLHHLRLLGLSGRVSFIGQNDIHIAYQLVCQVKESFPDVEVVIDKGPLLLKQSRATKDPLEIKKMQQVGVKTIVVLRETQEFIRRHYVRDRVFIKENGTSLTISDVKEYIIGKLKKQNLEVPEGLLVREGQYLLFSKPECEEAPIRLGTPYIFNLYPRGSHGYFHDVSRTWCFGYAVKQVKILYEDILGCLQYVKNACCEGISSDQLNDLVVKYYLKRGHSAITELSCKGCGFLDTLGHGVGLDIIEDPVLSSCSQTILERGHVMAFEPGLFYPDEGYGVRLGDTVYIGADGKIKTMSKMSYELIVPLK